MSVNRVTRSHSLISLLVMPLVLSGCLMNDPVEPEQNSFTPPEVTNDAPLISGTPPQMVKVGVNYSFTPTASDPDADPLTFSVDNAPNWTEFDTATGELAGMPTLGSEGSYNDIMIMVSDGQVTSELPAFTITVEPATAPNMPPVIAGNAPDAIVIDAEYSFRPTATDPDGDPLTFSVTNKPEWATFNAANGRLFGTPLAGDEGDYTGISITVSDGRLDASLPAFNITVRAGNTPPTIDGNAPTTVAVGGTYSFRPDSADVDGDELDFDIANKPDWATFNRSNGRLFGVPEAGDEGTYANVMIEVTDGKATAMLPEFSITVEAAPANNARPTITGSPGTSITSGNNYNFMPSGMDADNDPLTFSISNKPSWATFNTGNGRLSGTPARADAGTYSDIIISVSDGQLSASLAPFSIAVTAANRAPVISGNPPAAVVAGQAYNFRPTASDPDNDTLTFAIQGKPSWANFNTSNGRLSGTPAVGDVGTYSNIRISVSDGDLSDALTAFTITVNQPAASTGSVTLSWTPPTQNTDGTPLSDLAGYRIYYGTSAGNYPNSVVLNNPGLSSYVVEDLAPGTYFFVSTAVNSSGVESDYSNMAQKTVSLP